MSYIKKRAVYTKISLFISLIVFFIHLINKNLLIDNYSYNITIDLVIVGISIINLLIIDEIETRRNFIKEVFESRYDKKK